MERKFLKLIENTIERYSNGGILTGDPVRLVKNYKSKDSYKKLSDQMKKYIDNFFNGDSNYIAVNVKTSTNTPGPGNNDNRGDEFTVEVGRQTAPGRYDNQGKVTLSGDLLEVIDYGVNQKPVDPKTRGDNKVQIDPKEVDEEEYVKNNNVNLTNPRVTQQGDSIKGSELKLASKNTKIPSSPATASPAIGENYTAQYMPINSNLFEESRTNLQRMMMKLNKKYANKFLQNRRDDLNFDAMMDGQSLRWWTHLKKAKETGVITPITIGDEDYSEKDIQKIVDNLSMAQIDSELASLNKLNIQSKRKAADKINKLSSSLATTSSAVKESYTSNYMPING